MLNVDNLVVLNIDSMLLGGSLLELIDRSVFIEDAIDILGNSNISELDIIIGEFNLEKWNVSNVDLKSTEPFIIKLGEMLVHENLATRDECFDVRSIIALFVGAAGYKRFHSIVEKKYCHEELSILIFWLYSMQNIPVHSLYAGIEVNENEYRNSASMKVLVRDIFNKYESKHKEDHFLNDDLITVIPNYWWIQKIQQEKREYKKPTLLRT